MNWVDLFIVLVLIGYAVSGYFRGFIKGFALLIGLVSTVTVAWLLHGFLATILTVFFSAQATPVIAFLLLLVLLYIGYALFIQWMYQEIPEEARKSEINRFLGIFTGLADGIIIAALLLTIIAILPFEVLPKDEIDTSLMGGPLLSLGSAVRTKALDEFGDAVQALIPIRMVEPKTNERIKLPFRTAKGAPDPTMEREMLHRVNQERMQRGFQALIWDDRLKLVALEHSQDMLQRGYFAHYSPEGHDVSWRLESHGLTFRLEGENLALAPTLALAHEGLMKSPGHRANILHPGFTHVGIGIVVARPYGIMVTQVFAKE